MSLADRILRSVAAWLVAALMITAIACSRPPHDPGADRSQGEAKELRDRLSATQIDR